MTFTKISLIILFILAISTVSANSPPSISTGPPSDGATVSFSSGYVSLNTDYSDPDGDYGTVSIYVNGNKLDTRDVTSDYDYRATYGPSPDTTYSWYAVAKDGEGHTTTSPTKTFEVPPHVDPSISLQNPSNGASIGESSTVQLSASATDSGNIDSMNGGEIRIYYYLDGKEVDYCIIDSGGSCSVTASVSGSGSHSWYAYAYDGYDYPGTKSNTRSFTGGPNTPPNADIYVESNVCASGSVYSSASESSDPDGSISTYEWDTDNDGNYDDGSGQNNYATYGSEGQYTISVRVTDNGGAVDTASDTVDYDYSYCNDPPSAFFTSNSPVLTFEGFGLDASGSSDSDGDSLSYEWDIDNDGVYDDASGVSPQISKPDDGSYTVSLRVKDGNGASDTYSKTITVENRDPIASFSFNPSSPALGESVSFDGAGSSDDDGSISSYEWDWTNDGVFESTGSTAPHSYSSEGEYTVKLRVTDNDGSTDSYTDIVPVGDQTMPEIDNVSPEGVVRDSTPRLSANFSDNYDLATYELSIDGSLADSGSLSGTSGSVSYTPGNLQNGNHSFSWTVTDSGGNSNSRSSSFTVSILRSTLNSAPKGALWIQSSDLRWAGVDAEYWLKDASVANSDSSGPSGALWIQDTKIHWIDQLGDERSYQGSEVATNVGGPSGALWVQNGYIHYIDQDGDERVTDGK